MDLVEATQVINDDIPQNYTEDKVEVGSLKVGSESHAIYKGINRIGRSPICRVIFSDVTVSKVHAEIQAGVETAFISDLRSSNGTKIKDVSIKPFHYYSINHGDVIYFGQVRAEYTTTIKTTESNDFVVPETPAASKNRHGSEKRNSGIGNVSEGSFLNNSSMYDSDVSLIPGTQETEKKKQTFQKPSTTIKNSPNVMKKLDDDVQVTDIHEMETQNDVDLLCRPAAPKRLRLQKNRENAHENETNIHEAETQAMPTTSPKRKEIKPIENQDDIFEAETQVMSIKMNNQRESKKIQNDDDIFDAETQAMPIKISNKKDSKKSQIQDDIFEAETQGLPMTISKQKVFKKSQNQEDIYDAETQAMEISDRETPENIYEMATQVVSKPLRNNEINNLLLNETEESSLRSNSSHGRLHLSSTPPSSPENLDDMCESQDLLEIAETPLLAYEKIKTKKSSQEQQRISKNDEEEKNIGEKKSPYRRRVQTIPESSESETDDERAPTRIVRKSKPSNVIEDSSDEDVTDEENVFGASAIKGKASKKNIREKSTGTPSVEDVRQLEVNKVRSSPLRLRKNPQVSSEKILSGGSSSKEKSLVSVSEESSITIEEVNEDTETKKFVSSPTSQEKKREEISTRKSTETLRSRLGASPLRLSRQKDNNSSAKIGKVGEVKSNLFGGSDKKIDDSTTKNHIDQESKNCGQSPSKKFDSPTIIFQNGEEISIEKNDKLINDFDALTPMKPKNQADISGKSKNEDKGSKNIQSQAGSNTVRDSPKKKDPSSKNQKESSINETSSNKSGRSSLCLLRKGDNNSPKIYKNAAKSKQLEDSPLRKKLSTQILETKKIDEEDEGNIFEAATQRINRGNTTISVNNRSDDKTRDLEAITSMNDDIDIDLLPTQILDVPSSTPFTRKTRAGKNVARQEFYGDDLHCAPTQIINVESLRNENDNDILVTDDKNEEKTVDKEKKKTIDLDDSLAINLGNLLGEEASNDNFRDDDDATQLMTQNLVDILRPSQNFNETEPHAGKSSSRVTENVIGQGTFDSPLRKRIYAPGTLGFIDGEARDSGELVSVDSSPIKEAKNDENIVEAGKADEADKVNKLDTSASHHDEDDIFFGLPEVKIAGTLAYPGSPVSSEASSPDVSPRSIINTSRFKYVGKKRSFSNLGSSTSNVIDSTDPDSPITPKKSRITRRDASRYRITDDVPDDSEDDFDYQDLKRMADRLLATESSYDSKTKKKIDEVSVSLGSSGKGKKKIVESKKNVALAINGRTTKASCGPSSFIVSDAKSESSGKSRRIVSMNKRGSASKASCGVEIYKNYNDDNECPGETRKSTRQRKPTKKAADLSNTTKVVAKQQQQQQSSSKESQEIEAILSTSVDENLPMISRKSYVKVQLTRVDDSKEKDGEKVSNVPDRPKVTRTRRTISAVKKEESSPSASPAKRVRRTIAETPGIPGNNEIDHKIMFTGVNTDSYCKIVEKLGGTVVSEPSKATVLITDKVRRTYKFLCAVALGIRVVSINWLLESNKASRFLDCDKFILQEPAAEAQYKFKLEQSLKIAKTKKFLEGYTIVVTPKVNQPEIHELKAMVEAGGGRLLVRPPGPRSWNEKTVIISREEDYAVAKSYLAKVPKNLKITVQSKEFILTGILRQEVNLVEHVLDFT